MNIGKAVLIPLLAICVGATAAGGTPEADPKSKTTESAPTPSAKKAPSKRTVAATVNGAPIYLDQLDPLVEAQKKGSKGKNQPHSEQLRLLRQVAVQEAIRAELVYQEAMRHKSPDLEKKVAAREKELREKHPGLFKGKDPLEVRETIRRTIATDDFLVKKGIAHPQIPEKEIKAMYEKLKPQFVRPESVHVRHIVVLVKAEASQKEKEAARKKITEAHRLLKEGRPFEEVARKYSEDKAAENGGDLGFAPRGFMPKPLEDVAFALPKGKLSDVVETLHGFHVLEVLEKDPGGVIPYEERRDWLHTYLMEQTRRQKMNALLEDLKKKAKIEIHLK